MMDQICSDYTGSMHSNNKNQTFISLVYPLYMYVGVHGIYLDINELILILSGRNECDQVAGDLKKAGIKAAPYHAGLSDSQRTSIQDRWLNENGCKVRRTSINLDLLYDNKESQFISRK